MAQPAAIDIKGMRQFRRDLKQLDNEVDKRLRGELREIAADVAAEAAVLAPRRTGALAASYKPFVTQRGAGVRSRLPYAPVIEYGGTIRPQGRADRDRSLPARHAGRAQAAGPCGGTRR